MIFKIYLIEKKGEQMNKSLIPVIFNLIIVLLVIFATVCMYTGFEFMGHATSLTADSINMLQFYTVQSNLLIGIISCVMMIYQWLLYKDKIDHISGVLFLLKLMFTVGVAITFLVTVFYLAPATGEDWYSLFLNSNFFFHLVIPILAIVNFVFFEKTNSIKFYLTPLCLLPTLLYGIYYLINAFSHLIDGVIDPAYDWYGFAQNGVAMGLLVFGIMLLFAYLITWVLWKLNRAKLVKQA